MIFNLNLFLDLLVYLLPGFFKLKTVSFLKVWFLYHFKLFFYVPSIYIKLQQFWGGQIFLWPQSGCGPILICKIHKMQKKIGHYYFFIPYTLRIPKMYSFLLLIKNSHGIVFSTFTTTLQFFIFFFCHLFAFISSN